MSMPRGINSGAQQRNAQFRIVAQIRLPKPYDTPSAGSDVCILASVKGNAAEDSRLGTGALAIVPVVAVKLNYQACRLNNGVGRELAPEGALSLVVNCQPIQQSVSSRFGTSGAPGLLKRVHRDESSLDVRVLVSASDGTVDRSPVDRERRRQAEVLAAHLTGVMSFPSSLPDVVASNAAKAGNLCAVCLGVEALPARLARKLSPTAMADARTDQAAEALAAWTATIDRCAARLAASYESRCNALADCGAEAGRRRPAASHVKIGTALFATLCNARPGSARRHKAKSTATGRPIRFIPPLIKYAEVAARRLCQDALDFEAAT